LTHIDVKFSALHRNLVGYDLIFLLLFAKPSYWPLCYMQCQAISPIQMLICCKPSLTKHLS